MDQTNAHYNKVMRFVRPVVIIIRVSGEINNIARFNLASAYIYHLVVFVIKDANSMNL